MGSQPLREHHRTPAGRASRSGGRLGHRAGPAGSGVRSPQGLLCHAARCRLVRVPLRGARSILRPVSVPRSSRAPAAGLRTFLAAALHPCPPSPPAATSLAGCSERIRAPAFHRRVVPGARPDGETFRVPRQRVTARVPCKIPSSSSVNRVFSRCVFYDPCTTT